MYRRWIRAALALATAVAVPLVMEAPAGAASRGPDAFAVQAAGRAFRLSAGGHAITAGSSSVRATSAPKATARGIGSDSPLGDYADQTASATGPGQGQTRSQTCKHPPVPLPPPPGSLPGVGLKVLCSSARASTPNGLPQGKATARVVQATVDLRPVVGGLTSRIPAGTPLAGGLRSALAGVGIPGPVAGRRLGPVLETLMKTDPSAATAVLTVGRSRAQDQASPDSVVGTATSTGVDLKLFPVHGTPLVDVKLAPEQAKVVLDRATGALTPVTHPVAATVTVGGQTRKVPPGKSTSIPGLGTIYGASGSTAKHPQNVSATARGLAVDLGQGSTALALDVATVRASLAYRQGAAAAGPCPCAPGGPHKTLPYTGEAPWIPVAGLAALTAAAGTWRFRGRLR
ncbi:MAG TPA: hypothetical protein VE152_10870 [Acidimicrobiales bacterium]|nr:hypothetical protein [Acidimicrobiales bacterium]